MKKILIFKTDRIGDFVYFSPCLKIIKDNVPDSEITVVCSKYNYQIVKNYKEINKIIVINKMLILDFFLILKNLIFKKFDYLLQMDGNKRSYFFSLFIFANKKACVFYYKIKNFFSFKIKLFRPNYFIRLIFPFNISCNEDYETNFHYQKLYFDLMSKLSFDITSKQNIFYLDDNFKKDYEVFSKILPDKYFLFHIDNKSDNFSKEEFISILNFIDKIKRQNHVILSLGIEKIKYYQFLKDKYKIISFDNLNNLELLEDIVVIEDLPLNLLAYFIKYSLTNISMHSGSIVHISAALDKNFIDIIPSHKFKELNRWIPVISKYRRVDVKNISSFEI